MNIYQILAIGAMLSPIVYTAMWILGGILQPDYSHIRDDISSLFAVDAPNQRLFQAFTFTSSALLFIFYLGLHEGLNDGGTDLLGPFLFILSGGIGILIALFFPLDAGGELVTLRGKMHLILVVIMGILTIGGMLALWIRLDSVTEWSIFATFSLFSAIVSLILIVIAGIFTSGRYRGIVERIGVTPYQLYYFVLGLLVFLNN
ncbi:MAG: DUF998 domain-containing protein [Candidatus Hodarchaeales archaeon]|jgi:hypothetical protein